jgi:hypothetical protein
MVSAAVLITKILKRSDKTLPDQVNVELGIVETIWKLEYQNNENSTILWENLTLHSSTGRYTQCS